MKFKLPYGRNVLRFDLPGSRVKGVLTSGTDRYRPDCSQRELVRRALMAPVASDRLEELARGCNEAVIICSDHTRPVPSRYIIPQMLAEIRRGSPGAAVKLLIATGVHRPPTADELTEKFGGEIFDSEELIIHRSDRSDDMVECGRLPSGGRLLLNRHAVESELLVAEGFIEPHFFAGYSGGRKSVLPGVAGTETVLANHCSRFIAHEKARTGILDGNPIHEDMLYAARRAGLAFIVNVVIGGNGKILNAFAGHFSEAHRTGCEFLAALTTVPANPADVVITSNGGYPMDRNIYQSVKGMTAAEATCREGGVIIIAAECCDGHGGKEFYKTFLDAESPGRILEDIAGRGRTETAPDQWESQILARILEKFSVIMVTSAPRNMVENMFMKKAESVREALSLAEEITGKASSSVTVVPDGVGVTVVTAR